MIGTTLGRGLRGIVGEDGLASVGNDASIATPGAIRKDVAG
jgi:hypothetical protein